MADVDRPEDMFPGYQQESSSNSDKKLSEVVGASMTKSLFFAGTT